VTKIILVVLLVLSLGCRARETTCGDLLDSCASKCRNVQEVEQSTACYLVCADAYAKCRVGEGW
jgi:hypothetical protein